MRIRNANRWASGSAVSYTIGIAATVIAFAVRYFLHPMLQAHYPFLFFTIAALLVSFFAGFRPAMLVVTSGLLIGTYFFVPPFKKYAIPEIADLYFVGGYVCVAVLGSYLIERLQRARYEAQLLMEVAQSRLEMLERSRAACTQAENIKRRIEATLDALTPTLPPIFYICRIEGNTHYASDQFYRYTGCRPGSLGPDDFWDAIHPQDAERMKREWSQVAETGIDVVSNVLLRRSDGIYERFGGRLTRVESRGRAIIKWIGTRAPAESARAAVAA